MVPSSQHTAEVANKMSLSCQDLLEYGNELQNDTLGLEYVVVRPVRKDYDSSESFWTAQCAG